MGDLAWKRNKHFVYPQKALRYSAVALGSSGSGKSATTQVLTSLLLERGREIAIARGLAVLGILRLLAEAKQRGLIPAVRPLVEALLAIGYWIDDERVIQPFMQEMREEQSREV